MIVPINGVVYFFDRYSLFFIGELINYKMINTHYFDYGEYCCDYTTLQ